MRVDSERVADIMEAIERIEHQLPKGKEDFFANELLQVWIIHHIQIIGEAASRISREYRENTPQIAWGKIIGTRNVIIHGYFDIDLDIVWEAITKDIPILREQISQLIDQEIFGSKD